MVGLGVEEFSQLNSWAFGESEGWDHDGTPCSSAPKGERSSPFDPVGHRGRTHDSCHALGLHSSQALGKDRKPARGYPGFGFWTPWHSWLWTPEDEFPAGWSAEKFLVIDAGKGRVALKNTRQNKVISSLGKSLWQLSFHGIIFE